MPNTSSGRRPGPIRRLLAAIADQLPSPPDGRADPELEGLEGLSPEEREARLKVSQGRFRWGRGDGGG
jgi:hypothetical protein